MGTAVTSEGTAYHPFALPNCLGLKTHSSKGFIPAVTPRFNPIMAKGMLNSQA
jgi:hypothetical protein